MFAGLTKIYTGVYFFPDTMYSQQTDPSQRQAVNERQNKTKK